MLFFDINHFGLPLTAIYVKFVKTTCCIWPSYYTIPINKSESLFYETKRSNIVLPRNLVYGNLLDVYLIDGI
jgi:hypothetical protein